MLSGQGAAEGLKGSGVWEKRAEPERGDRKRAKSGTIPVKGSDREERRVGEGVALETCGWWGLSGPRLSGS